jgi:hypothetical protein
MSKGHPLLCFPARPKGQPLLCFLASARLACERRRTSIQLAVRREPGDPFISDWALAAFYRLSLRDARSTIERCAISARAANTTIQSSAISSAKLTQNEVKMNQLSDVEAPHDRLLYVQKLSTRPNDHRQGFPSVFCPLLKSLIWKPLSAW